MSRWQMKAIRDKVLSHLRDATGDSYLTVSIKKIDTDRSTNTIKVQGEYDYGLFSTSEFTLELDSEQLGVISLDITQS